MDSNAMLIIVILTFVGLACGIAIYLANKFLPEEDKLLKHTEEIAQYLPGMNCGACGQPGCFAYAGAVAEDIDTLQTSPCMTLLNDDDAVAALGKALNVDLSGGVKKVALIHCAGDSEILYEYEGISTCKGAVQISSGNKKCPYACLGFGDCSVVCPEDAISIDEERRVAVVDTDKCIGCGLCVKECPQNMIEIVPAAMPQFLACNYQSKKNIPGRDRCSIGCIHCRLCVKASPDGEVTWDSEKDLPNFDHVKLMPAPGAIEKCPKKVIFKRENSGKWN